MLDIGWSELLVVGVLALLVVGPKELPRLMRSVGQWAGKARSMAREFQRSMDDVAREADLKELADARNMLNDVRNIHRDATKGMVSPTSWAKDALQQSVTPKSEPAGVAGGAGSRTPPPAKAAGSAETADAPVTPTTDPGSAAATPPKAA